MKLRFEQFEGIACLTVREKVEASQIRILAVGFEAMIRDLSTPIIINFTLAEVDDAYLKILVQLKKGLAKVSKQKVYWIGKTRELSDFKDLSLLFSRLGGFKLRQVGERLKLEESIYVFHTRIQAVKAKVESLGGDDDNAHKIILENLILREKNRILKHTIQFQEERMKGQERVPSVDQEYAEKVQTALQALKTAYGMDLKL